MKCGTKRNSQRESFSFSGIIPGLHTKMILFIYSFILLLMGICAHALRKPAEGQEERSSFNEKTGFHSSFFI